MGGTWPLVNVQYVSDIIFCIVTFGNEFTTLEFGFKEIVVLSLRSEQPFGVKLGVPSPSDHGAPEHLPWVSGLMSQKSPPARPPSPGSTPSLTICFSDQVQKPFVSTGTRSKGTNVGGGSDNCSDLLSARPCPRQFPCGFSFNPPNSSVNLRVPSYKIGARIPPDLTKSQRVKEKRKVKALEHGVGDWYISFLSSLSHFNPYFTKKKKSCPGLCRW